MSPRIRVRLPNSSPPETVPDGLRGIPPGFLSLDRALRAIRGVTSSNPRYAGHPTPLGCLEPKQTRMALRSLCLKANEGSYPSKSQMRSRDARESWPLDAAYSPIGLRYYSLHDGGDRSPAATRVAVPDAGRLSGRRASPAAGGGRRQWWSSPGWWRAIEPGRKPDATGSCQSLYAKEACGWFDGCARIVSVRQAFLRLALRPTSTR